MGTTQKQPIKLHLLLNEVEEAFGRKITTAGECILLSEEIFAKTSFRINSNTLRRFFGLVKARYAPSSATLTILSKYCGFDSLEDLQSFKTHTLTSLPEQEAGEVLKYLLNLYRSTPVKKYNDETFLAVTKHTINFLQQYPSMALKFQRAVAATKNGQDFYFEQFVHIDALNSFYGEGLRHYLKEKKNAEAQIFGHSILCLKGWLSNDPWRVQKHFEEVMKFRLSKSIHPFVCGRYFATQLFSADMKGSPVQTILSQAHHIHGTLTHDKEKFQKFPAFEYVISFALLMTGHYDEAGYYANYANNNYPEKNNYLDEGYYQSLHLIEAIALAKTGKRKEAMHFYKQIRPSRFYSMTKKLDTMIYLWLSSLLQKSKPADAEQFSTLLGQTGFQQLQEKGTVVKFGTENAQSSEYDKIR